jgi:hypothetical protein
MPPPTFLVVLVVAFVLAAISHNKMDGRTGGSTKTLVLAVPEKWGIKVLQTLSTR